MKATTWGRAWSAGMLLVAVSAAAIGQAVRGWDELSAALAAPVPGPAVEALARLLAVACVCWLSSGALLTVLGNVSWPGTHLARRLASACTPRCWRTVVLTAVGVGALASPGLAAATAASEAHGRGSAADPPVAIADPFYGRHGLAMLDGLVLPDRPSGAWRGGHLRTVVVVPGDDLWSIAAQSLPTGANLAVVASACERWYEENADVIGDDPDLLLPGAHLQAPSLPAGPRSRSPR